MVEEPLKQLHPQFPVPEDVKNVLVGTVKKRPKTFYEKFCAYAHRIMAPLVRGYRLGEETKRNLRIAGFAVASEEWAAGMLLSFLLPAVPFFLLWVFVNDLLGALYLPITGLLLGGLSSLLFQVYPVAQAANKKSEAQSRAVNTIVLLSFFLYHRPDLRGATIYAADSSEGKLAEDLRRGLFELDERRRYETVRHLLTSIANEWGEIDDNVRQAIFDILRSSGTRDDSLRVLDITKAPTRVLEGSEEQLSRKLGALIMPTLAFLTFSSLAIIGAVGLSPIFAMVGIHLVDLKFFVGISLALIVSFLAFTLYMERQRPATVQLMEGWKEDPRLPPPGKVKIFGFVIPSLLIPLVLFLLVGFPGIFYLMDMNGGVLGYLATTFSTLWLVWGAGLAVATYGYLHSATRRRLRDEERRKVSDWANAFNTIGSRMLDGKSAQRALAETAELMKGSALAQELSIASSKMRDFGLSLEEAVVGRRRYNRMVLGFLRIISRIRKDNEMAAGRACMLAADFLRTLQRVERRFREKIGEAMSNLWLVATVLIPVVCAMAVWVMNFMSGMKYTILSQAEAAGISGIPLMLGAMEATELSLLRLLMGLTAIVLSAIIGRYIAVIRAPRDSVELWSSVAKSTLLSMVVFTATSILLVLLLG